MKDSSVVFLKDWSMLIQSLSNENQLYFWGLFMQYEHEVEIQCDNEFVKPIWNFVKLQLDKMKEKYFEKTVLTNRNNGKLGGRPKKEVTQDNPNNPIGLNKTQITPKGKGNNNDKDNKKDKVFIPPNLEDVILFFTENNYSKKIADKAFHYYNDADWKDKDGNQVNNWKQKMRGNWFKDEYKTNGNPQEDINGYLPNETLEEKARRKYIEKAKNQKIY